MPPRGRATGVEWRGGGTALHEAATALRLLWNAVPPITLHDRAVVRQTQQVPARPGPAWSSVCFWLLLHIFRSTLLHLPTWPITDNDVSSDENLEYFRCVEFDVAEIDPPIERRVSRGAVSCRVSLIAGSIPGHWRYNVTTLGKLSTHVFLPKRVVSWLEKLLKSGPSDGQDARPEMLVFTILSVSLLVTE